MRRKMSLFLKDLRAYRSCHQSRKAGCHLLEGALELAVRGEVDVVRNAVVVVDASSSCSPEVKDGPFGVAIECECAPVLPTALGRWKIQFCQAVSRPKILVSAVLGTAKAEVLLHASEGIWRA